ncbi:sugar ABC transporter permease [Castellaniella sp. FW104-16D08]|uniref:carbohydrate ABC transporter permease n=1 Tax=unclassified Castellaniella TaxID=2617606 RepID=UPI0033151B0E
MRQDGRIIALFIASILVIVAITGGGLVYSIKLSFYASQAFNETPKWVGLANYVQLVQDPAFWAALVNGLEISLSAILLQTVIGVAIALVLNQKFHGQGVVRALAVLPYFLPPVVAVLVGKWIFDPNYGLIKYATSAVGLRMFDWGADAWSAKGMIVLVSLWLWTPFVTTCVLAALQNIPEHLYEAARVDGATAWQQFWHITFPGLKSILIIVILLRSIWMFNKFDVIWLLTKGGPLDQTETLPILAYRRAFVEFNLGSGATVATVSFLLLAVVVLLYLKLFPIDDAKNPV